MHAYTHAHPCRFFCLKLKEKKLIDWSLYMLFVYSSENKRSKVVSLCSALVF